MSGKCPDTAGYSDSQRPASGYPDSGFLEPTIPQRLEQPRDIDRPH